MPEANKRSLQLMLDLFEHPDGLFPGFVRVPKLYRVHSRLAAELMGGLAQP